jgi:hypothetical protein
LATGWRLQNGVEVAGTVGPEQLHSTENVYQFHVEDAVSNAWRFAAFGDWMVKEAESARELSGNEVLLTNCNGVSGSSRFHADNGG